MSHVFEVLGCEGRHNGGEIATLPNAQVYIDVTVNFEYFSSFNILQYL